MTLKLTADEGARNESKNECFRLVFFSFFLPGGRIDHGHHDGKAVKALNEAVAMNKAVTKALQMVNKGKITPLIAIYLFFKGLNPPLYRAID